MRVEELMEHLRTMELYGVVCSDQHIVLGPFETLTAASNFAGDMTEEGDGCTYHPVPFVLILDKAKLEDVAKTMGYHDVASDDRGYL